MFKSNSINKPKTKKRKISPKNNYFLKRGIEYIDYKDTHVLRSFLNPQGRIVNKIRSQLTAKQQRFVAKVIKRARQMALLPYTKVEQKID